MGGSGKTLLKVTDKPFLHRSVMITMSGQRGNKTNRSKAVSGNSLLKSFALERIGISGIPVQIQYHWRFIDPFWFHDIEIQRIPPTPLYLDELHRVCRVIVKEYQGPRRHKVTAIQTGCGEIFGNTFETRVRWIGNRWRGWDELRRRKR